MLRILTLFISLACPLLFAAPDTAKPLVFVSIAPQIYLVKGIGGDAIKAQVMLRAGESAETFDPSQGQIRALHNAQLYFRIGVPFEEKWLDSFKDNHSGLKIIECCSEFINRQSVSLDNHIWTSVRNFQSLAGLTKDELIKLVPEQSVLFEKNYQQLMTQLQDLDREIRTLLRERRSDYFFISHAAFGHFANDYGLTQLALESEGRQLGAKSLTRIIRKAEQEKTKTLFVQKQHPSASAKAFARALNARIVEIDPLAEDYIGNLRSIATLISEATR